MDEDQDDVAAVLAGEHGAFERIAERHRGPVRAVLRGILGRSPSVDDLAQETFFRGWRALGSWRPARGSLRTWWTAIARHVAIDHLRRRARRPAELPLEGEHAAAPIEPVEASARLDRALEALPPERRLAFLLAEVHGLPLAEIARLEGVPVGTVKSRVGRAREALRASLAEEEPR